MWFVDIFEDVDMLKGRDTRYQAWGLEGLNPGEDSGYYTMWPLGIVLIGLWGFLFVCLFALILSGNTFPQAACSVWVFVSL